MVDLKRYVIWTSGANQVTLRYSEIPEPAPTEVLISVSHSLVSPGTEGHYLRKIGNEQADIPLGYCVAGEVRAVGAAVQKNLRPGDAVIAMGWQMAVHSNYALMPQMLVHKIPDGLPRTKALMANITATAVHAIDRARLSAHDRVLIVGMGLLGTAAALAASSSNCLVHVAESNPAVCSAISNWPVVDTNDVKPGDGYSCVFLCMDTVENSDLSFWFSLLNPEGTDISRSRLVNVGRMRGILSLDPNTGNIDLINVSRCGAGYRVDAFHHGHENALHPEGEATVHENLGRALAIIQEQRCKIAKLKCREINLESALKIYNSEDFFEPGINIICHQSKEDGTYDRG